MATNIPNYNYESTFKNYDYLTALETGGIASPKPNGASTNSGFGAMSMVPALTSLLGVSATLADIDAQNEATKKTLENQAKGLKYTQNRVEVQLDQIDRAMGDKLSASGMESMKRESRLKAASAETGGVGTSNQEAIATAEMDKLHRDATIIRTGDVQRENKMNEMVASRLNFESTSDALIYSQQSPLSAGLQTLNSGMKGLNMGLLYLNQSQREDFFGTNTTGVTNG